MSIQLEFVGHACFRLWENGKPVIVTDPFGHTICQMEDDGFRLDAETIIASSLTDPAHDNVELVRGQPQVINALDVATGKTAATINGEPLVTIAAREVEDHHMHDPMDNALYAFKAGGLWFAHLGDLGYGLDAEDLAPLAGKCDVMLAITGEELTLTLDDLDKMIEILSPTWIIPMHYGLPPLAGANGGGMTPVDAFLNRHPQSPVFVVRHHTVTFPLPKSETEHPAIIVLEPSAYRPTGGVLEFAAEKLE
jgi:hypothetical protein